MGDFRKGGNRDFGHRGGFRGRDGGRGGAGRNRDRGPVTMHQAVCDQCGKECEVPFKPSGDKPVYCNDCFGSKKDSGSRGNDRHFQKDFKSFKGGPSRDTGGNSNTKNDNEVKRQLEMLNEKMERLIKVVEAGAAVKPLLAGKKVKTAEKKSALLKTKKKTKKVSKK